MMIELQRKTIELAQYLRLQMRMKLAEYVVLEIPTPDDDDEGGVLVLRPATAFKNEAFIPSA